MSQIITTGSTTSALPEARTAITVRPGTMKDLPFVDALMKKHSKQLAFLPMTALEGKVTAGHLLIAQTEGGTRAGYLIGSDRYKSRDELGIIYQICVDPNYRRMLVGAHLLKARFDTSAYGCRLYCCWCAQDLEESSRFYESMGFVPIAYRAGGRARQSRADTTQQYNNSTTKQARVHIFWQKRIRAGDTTTPWWFPSETRGGLMDAARIALPIPPGMTWRDELPTLVPQASRTLEKVEERETASPKRPSASVRTTRTPTPEVARRGRERGGPRGGLYFGKAPAEAEIVRQTRQRTPLDPALAAKARELRDKWMEHVTIAPIEHDAAKYDLARADGSPGSTGRGDSRTVELASVSSPLGDPPARKRLRHS